MLAGFTLAVDWHDSSRALLFERIPHQSAIAGKPGLFVAAAASAGAGAGLVRSAAVAVSAAIAWLCRRSDQPANLLVAASVVLLVRPLAEPYSFSYYWVPGLFLAGLAATAARQRFQLRYWLVPLASVAWSFAPIDGLAWWVLQSPLLAAQAAQLIWISGWVGSSNGPHVHAPARRARSGTNGGSSTTLRAADT